MPSFPGAGLDQALPDTLRPLVDAITNAKNDAALVDALRHFKAWEFEQMVRRGAQIRLLPRRIAARLFV